MPRTIRVCPRCGSTDIGHDTTSVISRMSLEGSRECRECGYTGIFPEVDEEETDRFREEVAGSDREIAAIERRPRRGRMAVGTVLILLGLGATVAPTDRWLAGLLALAVGAAVLFEEIGRF